jgi:molybdopterin-guanine dinucleotide biosynthesis protein A
MRVATVIISGGKSSRMGREKAFIPLSGKYLLTWVIERIRPQCDAVVINANGDASRLGLFGLRVIPDMVKDTESPLAGLHAALAYGRDNRFDAVLVVPSDVPFLPRDLHSRLTLFTKASVAASCGQVHFLTGLWSVDLLPTLEGPLSSGELRRVQDWVRMCGANSVEWPCEPYDPFFNINTPEDLAEAERIAAEFAP